jgi:hypothetical protein
LRLRCGVTRGGSRDLRSLRVNGSCGWTLCELESSSGSHAGDSEFRKLPLTTSVGIGLPGSRVNPHPGLAFSAVGLEWFRLLGLGFGALLFWFFVLLYHCPCLNRRTMPLSHGPSRWTAGTAKGGLSCSAVRVGIYRATGWPGWRIGAPGRPPGERPCWRACPKGCTQYARPGLTVWAHGRGPAGRPRARHGNRIRTVRLL